jgi:hypothetical protein
MVVFTLAVVSCPLSTLASLESTVVVDEEPIQTSYQAMSESLRAARHDTYLLHDGMGKGRDKN